MGKMTGMTSEHLRRLLTDFNFMIPALQIPIICEALHIIIIAGAKNSGVPVEAGRETLDILKYIVYAGRNQDEALVDLQNLQKGTYIDTGHSIPMSKKAMKRYILDGAKDEWERLNPQR